MNAPTLEQRSETAWKRAQLTFAVEQDEPWRAKLAAELNVILARVTSDMLAPVDWEGHIDFAEAALSVVARVAEFEDIRRA